MQMTYQLNNFSMLCCTCAHSHALCRQSAEKPAEKNRRPVKGGGKPCSEFAFCPAYWAIFLISTE